MMVVVTILSVYIWAAPRAYPYRYMYPGLITFLFFMLLPTVFIVLIGFTNLGTGHLMSKKDVFKQLLEETAPLGEGPERSYRLVTTPHAKAGKREVIVLTDQENEDPATWLYAELPHLAPTKKNEEVSLTPFKTALPDVSPEQIEIVSKSELFKALDELKKFDLKFPGGEILKIRSLSELAERRFAAAGEDKLKEVKTGKIFYPDTERGVYTDGSEDLTGGFYVGVGLANYLSLITHPGIKASFFKIFSWSFVWALMSVLLTFSVGMILSLVLNGKFVKGKLLYRVLLIIPYAIPAFISILVFKGLFNEEFGVINQFLGGIGLDTVHWLTDPLTAKISCLLVNLWLGFPYMMLVTTGILQSIPENVFEASAIDGAGKWSTFWHITLPMIFSAVGPLLVGSFAFSFNNFAVIYLLNQGLPPIVGATTPAGETDILISYTYKLAFAQGRQDLGLSSSVAVLVFFIICIITLINFKVFGVFKDEKSRG
jgi:ABC-type sugar transport system permease subunit